MVQKKSNSKPVSKKSTSLNSKSTSKAKSRVINTKSKKSAPTTKNKSKQPLLSLKVKYEIQVIFLIGFTLISIFSIHTNAVGYIGSLIRGIYFGLFSKVAVISPYFVMLILFVNINPNLKEVKSKYNIALSSVFLAIILFYSTAVYDISREALDMSGINVNSINGLKEVYQSAIIGNGAGVFGTYISSIFISLFGKIGSYIIASVLTLLGIIIGTKVSLFDIWKAHKDVAIKTTNKAIQIAKSTNEAVNQRIVSSDNENANSDSSKNINDKNFKIFDSDSYIPQSESNDNLNIVKDEKSLENKSLTNEPIDKEKSSGIKISTFETNSNTTYSAADQIRSMKNSESIDNESDLNDSDDAKSSKNNKKENSKIDPNEASEVVSQLEKGTHETYENYIVPSINILKMNTSAPVTNKEEILAKAKLLEDTLGNFGVEAKVVEVAQGPAITMFELQPSPGVKVSKIVNLSDDIALSLAASQVRIIAPIPGKSAVGIEIPNKHTSMVMLRDVLDTKEFKENDSKLTFALGKDISGNPILSDLSKMPHLLIAGATGSGKSVCVNTLISTILFNANPDEVKFLMIDPKVVELNNYNGIPHLILPVVTDAKKASIALNWAVQEMTRRYQIFAEAGVRDVNSYNTKAKKEDLEKLAKIVVIIDELADLMMVAPNQVEDAICRLAQMARAAGIHLIVATQRPSVDVITGLIKANIPSRIAFSVSSMTDSRTILDTGGAEKLLGKGDMLFSPVGASKPYRVQGAFISDEEVEELVNFVKNQSKEVKYDESILDTPFLESNSSDECDEHLGAATDFVIQNGSASISMLQRKFRIGYNRAARLIDDMEDRGIVGPSQGSKAREVLVDDGDLENL